MRFTPLRQLFSLTLALLFCSAAGAAETERARLPSDTMQADHIEFQEVNGAPTIVKTFILEPTVNPEILREEPFMQDGCQFHCHHIEKQEQKKEDKLEASETAAIAAPSGRLEDVINQFPGTRPYNRDGYTGTLTLDTASIQIKPTGYETVTDSHPHRVTKQYALTYNDRSLVPETIEEDGMALPLISLDWTAGESAEGSDVPAGWVATAIYSKTIYSNRKVVTGYQAAAVYRGQVVKTSVDKIQYTVTYTGTKIPAAPDLPALSADGQSKQNEPGLLEIFAVLLVFLLVLLLLYCIKLSVQRRTAHIYVYGKFDNPIHAGRRCLSAKKPLITIPDCKGETVECVVLLPRHMAKKLSGQKVYVQSSGRSASHTVQPFVTGNYIFRVVLSDTSPII